MHVVKTDVSDLAEACVITATVDYNISIAYES